MKLAATGALVLFVRSIMGAGCPDGQVGVGTVQSCLIVNNMLTECGATQGVVFGAGNCDQADIENMFQEDGYCQPRTFLHGAKVFCEDDDITVTSVAYDLATWGNCKKQHVDCSAGPLQYLYIDYCCEKM
ncbi:uncharacterized protein J4E78_002488 [Alternaria triticimaculans]|uniref:uncharacterized protein n=1 Tax=Alternaria triticimaculans TaxID=297637 RepID=UPI0020C547EC|nr:uncharacterized protein J4E78_002488 [Alternaria triticimaculans]KAI4668660.1 hypothetical protein J4E78_002488 [Alternaria triticimaculans]